ncbi:PRD domain-containing protein [Sneathia sanguinegens]|uniref:PRD domain-containing protein n=1 Tax=Sneathia sanguinegens TaxID=40543 RepID=UPI00082B1262|nr:PRD domain-containing protein [Sneathia sanguinegens]
MEIIKILNNNTIIAKIKDKEFVILRKGIGFSKKIGDIIDENSDDKKYFLYDIPLKYYEYTKDIIEIYEKKAKIKLNSSLYITLTDHIYNAVNRKLNNIIVSNYLINEIKAMYPKEFSLAIDTISYIYQKTNVLLSEDDAGFITIHLINAIYENKKNVEIMSYINEIENIIKKEANLESFSDFKKYSRLVNYLKYLVIQKINNEEEKNNITDVYNLLVNNFKDVANIVKKIDIYCISKFNKNLSINECVYLIIYLKEFMEG